MATGSGLIAPGNFPTRNPKAKQQVTGRMVNSTDNYGNLGNMGPGDWNRSADFTRVEKPTNVRAAKPVAQRNDGE